MGRVLLLPCSVQVKEQSSDDEDVQMTPEEEREFKFTQKSGLMLDAEEYSFKQIVKDWIRSGGTM